MQVADFIQILIGYLGYYGIHGIGITVTVGVTEDKQIEGLYRFAFKDKFNFSPCSVTQSCGCDDQVSGCGRKIGAKVNRPFRNSVNQVFTPVKDRPGRYNIFDFRSGYVDKTACGFLPVIGYASYQSLAGFKGIDVSVLVNACDIRPGR